MVHLRRCPHITALLLLIGLASAATDSVGMFAGPVLPRNSPPFLGSGFLTLAFHASIVVNSTLYIDGGEVSWNASGVLSGGMGSVPMNSTLSIDLSSSWNPAKVAIQSTPKSSDAPVLNFESLWAGEDEESFYAFGGNPSWALASSQNPLPSLWQFSKGIWSPSNPNSASLSSVTRPASGLAASGNGVGYILGGFDSWHNPHALDGGFTPLPGMLSYNMTSGAWANSSSLDYSDEGTALVGAMQFVPNFGSNGLLIALGGESTGLGAWSNTGQGLRSFANISIYDPTSRSWYWQTATGFTGDADIPPPSNMFCQVGAQSDNSTYEILVYGGHDDSLVDGSVTPDTNETQHQSSFNQIYVLSLPGFVWFKANDTSGPAKYGHTCENIGNGQMVSIGGLDPSNEFFAAVKDADPFPQGLGIFNMVNLSWAQSYNADAGPYTAPDVVKEWYNRPNSNSSIQWTSPQLKALFVKPPNLTSPNATAPAPDSGSNMGAIAGGVVGGVVLLVLIAGAVLYFLRRNRRSRHLMQLDPERKETPKYLANLSQNLNRSQPQELQPHEIKEISGTQLSGELAGTQLRVELDGVQLRGELDGTGTPAQAERRSAALM